MSRVRTAVVGVGYLGAFHAEKFARLEKSNLIAVADVDRVRCEEVAATHGVKAVTDYRELAAQVDAVSIVVPTPLHFEVAHSFLEQGVHVLVEKPITSSVEEARLLVELARKRNLVLQVGHLERFNAVVLALRERLNQPRFIEAYRVSPFKERGIDVNVVLDLMIHDIDIAQTLVGSPIERIAANGIAVFSDKPDIANARIQFANGCVANLTASRISLKTERMIRLFQHDAYISMDLHARRLKIHSKVGEASAGKRAQVEIEEQTFENGDALRLEIAAFLDSVTAGTPPAVSGAEGKRALETAMTITGMVNKSSTSSTAIPPYEPGGRLS